MSRLQDVNDTRANVSKIYQTETDISINSFVEFFFLKLYIYGIVLKKFML